jgi:ABC-type molybdate transport system permease subunit
LVALPLLIAGFLLLMQDALNEFGYMIAFALSIPLLTAMSIIGTFLAFNDEDPERKFVRTTKVLSMLSMVVFGAVCLLVIYWMMASL